MSEPIKYRLPVGITTTQHQLRQLQKQLLKQQYQKMTSPNPNSPNSPDNIPIKISQRHSSQRNLHNPQTMPMSYRGSVMMDGDYGNRKEEEMRRMMSRELRGQIQEKEAARRRDVLRRLQEERAANQVNREIASREYEASKHLKQKIQSEITQDYLQKLHQKNLQKLQSQSQKQQIKARLVQLQSQSDQLKRKPTTTAQQNLLKQIPISAKVPEYYRDVASYQLENQRNYQEKVKKGLDGDIRRYERIVQDRIRENRRHEEEMERMERQARQNRKQQLQKMLQKQIEQSNQKKLQQKSYDRQKFYSESFSNIYHPINNPVDSRFCKDNKYIINEIYAQSEKKRSRGSRDSLPGRGEQEYGSALARKGSLALL